MERDFTAQGEKTSGGKPLTRRVRLWLAGAALCIVSTMAAAQAFEQRDFKNPEHEQRYRNLIAELRCLVCQNQNLADSNAPLAADLRNVAFEMIRNGKSDDEIRAFMVDRYGEFVLYRPPFAPKNVILWAGPFALLAFGLWLLYRQIRRRAAAVSAQDELSDIEKEALTKMLGQPTGESNRGRSD